ncbi:unnamed protein product [Rotaria magnacalcarata]|uniref:ZP domain-containing protein n=1 Tax=Rotaria magnacalcarata TaxID=392030 RepID=A0A820D9I6_9BILA|nr:unnamed protein product [Rotaria magnacalcarata]CAF4055933.1 unnamed protein product [Rotaria magnacalcarata]CAF4216019.1 unnamed protein product [Rotaria magnacalcarata]CAF4224968.1 unnamed protein product [Rotaria magnacalcarata]
MVEIEVNYTGSTVNLKFSGHMEDSKEMYLVDYDYSIREELNLAFYRNIFTTKVTYICLIQDTCTNEYVSLVVQRLINSKSILYELLPIYLGTSLGNRTITCVNTTNDEIPCYGGYCERITEEIVPWWVYADCRYPSESSVFSTVELTSLTAFFYKFVPENSATNHENYNKMTLLCNVDLCNNLETSNRGKFIIDEYNQAAFDFPVNDTLVTTLVSSLQTAFQSTNITSMSHLSSSMVWPSTFTPTHQTNESSTAPGHCYYAPSTNDADQFTKFGIMTHL